MGCLIYSILLTPQRCTGLSRRLTFWGHGHVSQALPRCCEDRVAHRRGNSHNAGFARSSRGQVLAIDQHDFDLRCVLESRQAVFGEERVQNSAIGKEDLLEKRSADGLNHGAHDLISQAIGIDDSARFQA